ncbi:MAG: molybdenum cofactor biosynthesis protein A [Firmicutes bacterium ADurb.Bin080]|jgi:TatD family-associated radical SAM protein|nr:radical SAM protein [Clostridiales bacterium]OQC15579.1 MAG: molybdenum cofactor biosynthesis protein A [Firmicutes bacterium ADurb.Bin080]
MNNYSYLVGNKLYINLTNRCSNSCEFCIRNTDAFHDLDLWLSEEPSANKVIESFPDLSSVEEEVVFCGYGEPTYKLENIIKISEYLHSCGKKTRLNTNGQAELLFGGHVPKKLSGFIDTVSISLNAVDKEKYNTLCHPVMGEKAFDAIIDFAKECKKYIPRVVLSVVDVIPIEDQIKAAEIAKEIGVDFRIRHYTE